LLVRNETPFNAEPQLPKLIEHMVTPTDRFFKRNHGPIPRIEPSEYRLTIDIVDGPRREWTLGELQSEFPHHEVMAALQCAGNRRDGLHRVKTVKGVIWGPGTISNAVWGGIFLRDVIHASGFPPSPSKNNNNDDDDAPPAYLSWHADFQAYGLCEEDRCYGSSVPLATVLDPLQDVLLAFTMNGAPLPRDHGYPCRVVVPGIIGARSVKWLRQVTVQPTESASFFQKRDYKIMPPEAHAGNLTQYWDRLSALQAMNIQSVVCYPTEGTPFPPWSVLNAPSTSSSPMAIMGYAISGGGARVDRVDVSLDNGQTWQLADLHRPLSCSAARRNKALKDLPTTKHWAWTLWYLTVPTISPQAVIVCRAWDANGNTQPEQPVWNYRGVMNNCWYR
ncbi:sulfite oxidase-like protein, partial [Dimargaris cristalligena]